MEICSKKRNGSACAQGVVGSGLAHERTVVAVPMELVDGEMEILVAGEWRAFAPGTHDYPLRGAAATNLPPGRCQLTITTNLLRLEWKPDQRRGVGAVVREVRR